MATTDKYDRQLRLWGAKGQRALADTTVVLFRATAAGTETLKNLVLPGVGRILVVDDCGAAHGHASNFFVTSQQQGTNKTRAQIALEHLQELNPDVQGRWKHVESMQTLDIASVLNNPNQLVVAADLEPPVLKNVSQACHELGISLVVVHSYGLIGSVRLQTPPLAILQPKPDNEPPDLRLLHPFAGFQEMAESIAMEQLDDAQHGRVPYPILLYKAAKSWKDTHGGSLPSNFKEKQEFRKSCQDASRNWDMEVNFHEACNNAYLAYSERTVYVEHLKDLQSRSEGSLPKLHAMVTGLLAFLESHNGQAPLQGTIPDMTASTDSYVKLQELYHEKAQEDMRQLRELVPAAIVSNEELEVFCKNVFNLDLLQTRTLVEEFEGTPSEELVGDWAMATFDPYEISEHTPLLWYIALRACHVFYRLHARYPGVVEGDDYEKDVAPLQECIARTVSEMKLEDNDLVKQTLLAPDKKYAKEMTRYANAEIHNVASILGGVASQEAVKIITGQYVPLNNTYIYNGIVSTAGVYNF